MKNGPTTAVRISKDHRDKLRKIAEAEKRSMTNYLEMLLDREFYLFEKILNPKRMEGNEDDLP